MIVEITESIEVEHQPGTWEEQTTMYPDVKNLHAADQLVELVFEDGNVMQFPVDDAAGAAVAIKLVIA